MNFRSDEDVRADDDVRTEFMPFIQSQYSASTRIISILESCREHILPDADIVSFFDNIFNIETASGVGLDIWGNIIGVSRFVPNYQDDTVVYNAIVGFINYILTTTNYNICLIPFFPISFRRRSCHTACAFPQGVRSE